jgi:hypothetical protein
MDGDPHTAPEPGPSARQSGLGTLGKVKRYLIYGVVYVLLLRTLGT